MPLTLSQRPETAAKFLWTEQYGVWSTIGLQFWEEQLWEGFVQGISFWFFICPSSCSSRYLLVLPLSLLL
ncbi:hypothetical protein Taro_018700 [Colocasia esculenta]|uniref:Uncharacterized protein n=1 Tax=Colocasia esculenta TaxID=4460 RepID=A0A843UJB1_COLES|nr:hypothetical protein [Colocasia esculenta]